MTVDEMLRSITDPMPPAMLPVLPRFEALNVCMPRRSAFVPRCHPDPEPAHGYTITPHFTPITVSAEELRSAQPLDIMWRLTGRP